MARFAARDLIEGRGANGKRMAVLRRVAAAQANHRGDREANAYLRELDELQARAFADGDYARAVVALRTMAQVALLIRSEASPPAKDQPDGR